MGEVINIKRSSDDDLFGQFQNACPDVPSHLDDVIKNAANRALGGKHPEGAGLSFKTVCLVVAGACLIGASIVRGVTTRWNNAVDSVAAYSQPVEAVQIAAALPGDRDSTTQSKPSTSTATGNADSWRRSKSAWAAYIQHLESDPFYQHVQDEKRRFEEQYP